MNKKILVSSNCQTGGLAATLKAIFPGYDIKPFPLPSVNDAAKCQQLRDELSQCQTWVTSGHFEFANNTNVKLCRVPQVVFYAFHPDLCYVKNKNDGSIITPHYNSKIAVWAFNNNIELESAVKLFTSKIYKSLGYFDGWYNSELHLKKLFLSSDYTDADFRSFFLSLKRSQIFMYSVNHPRVNLIVALGRIVAKYISEDLPELNREIVIPDSLTDTIWPLYPEIGEQLGLEGDYVWRIAGCDILGVECYLNKAFKTYSELGLKPGDIEIVPDIHYPVFDDVQNLVLLNEVK